MAKIPDTYRNNIYPEFPERKLQPDIDPTVFETTGWSEAMGENTYELTNAVMKMRFTTKKAKKTTKKKKSTKRKK